MKELPHTTNEMSGLVQEGLCIKEADELVIPNTIISLYSCIGNNQTLRCFDSVLPI